jgi:hypothetical protein
MLTPAFQNAAKRSAAFAISVGIFVIVLEVGLRLIGFGSPPFLQPEPVLGLVLTPRTKLWQSVEGHAWSTINSNGWRDRERPKQKPPGTYRVAVLGDSCVQASQVAFEDSLCPQLEERLRLNGAPTGRQLEVLCFGVVGYGTAQELLAFRQRVADFDPDFVLLLFYPGNDVSDNWKPLNHAQRISPYFTLDGDRLVLDDSFLRIEAYRDRASLAGRAYYAVVRHSRLAQLVHFVRHRGLASGSEDASGLFGNGDAPDVYRPPRHRDWLEAWRVTEALIRQMHRDVLASGAKFGVAVASTPSQVFADRGARQAAMQALAIDDLFYPNRRIQALGAEAGFPVLTLGDQLQAVADERHVFLHGFDNTQRGIGHWNAEGYRVAAEFIARWLADVLRMESARPGAAIGDAP